MIHFIRVAFGRRAVMLGLALAMLTCSVPVRAESPGPQPTTKVRLGPVAVVVRVYNKSKTCVWVSVGYATFYTPWAWMRDPHNTARFVHPNGYFDFAVATANVLPVPVPWEVKVEGTFMTNSDCSGAHAREITAIKKGIVPKDDHGFSARAIATLSGESPATYHVEITHQ